MGSYSENAFGSNAGKVCSHFRGVILELHDTID